MQPSIYLKLDVKDKIVMDVGQSTGGFTDCLLQHGAARVVGIDVGHTQLHPSLQTNFKVVCIEDLNVKDLTHNELFLLNVPAKKFDMLVMDVSFISITKVIPFLPMFLSEGAEYLILVKPQYECGQVNLDRNGVVKNKSVYGLIESQVKSTAIQYFKNVEAYFQSGLTGRDGNQEFFIYGKNYI